METKCNIGKSYDYKITEVEIVNLIQWERYVLLTIVSSIIFLLLSQISLVLQIHKNLKTRAPVKTFSGLFQYLVLVLERGGRLDKKSLLYHHI